MKKAPPVRLSLRKLFVGLFVALLMGTVGYPNAPSSAPKAVATCFCDPSVITDKGSTALTSASAEMFLPSVAVSATVSDNLAVTPMATNAMTGAGHFTAPDLYTSTQPDLREVGRTRIVVTTAPYLSNNRTTSASAFGSEKVGGPEIV